MIVVDASAIVEVLLRGPETASLEFHMFEEGHALHAPELLDIEVAQVLRRYASRGEISEALGRDMIDDLLAMPMTRHPHDFLLPDIWAMRHNFTAYDAAYATLAQALGAAVLTRDRRFADALRKHGSVEVI